MSGSGGGQSQVLREFLMRLGYEEDEQSRRKFTDAIKSMTLTVAALGTAVVSAAAGVLSGVRQMASSADAIYFVSQRTKASARDIDALQESFTNLGGTAGQARAALEKLGDFVRASPGNVNYLESLTGKKWHDAATGMEELSEAFQKQIKEGTDISVVFQEAAAAGLSQADVLVLLQKDFKSTAEEYRAMADKIIGDSKRQQEIVENAHAFTVSYNELSTAVNLFATNFGDMLATKLKPSIDSMKHFLEEHSEAINAFLEKASVVIVHAIEGLVHFGEAAAEAFGKLYEMYKELSPAGQHLADVLLAVGAALVLMNTAIGSSPLVRLGVLAAGLVAVYQSYEHWKKTGEEGFIDWKRWEPDIKAAMATIESMIGYFRQGIEAVGGWKDAFAGLLGFVTAVWAVKMGIAIASVATALAPILAAMAVFGVAAAAGYYIAHSIEGALSDEDKAKQMADRMNLTASGIDNYYQDKSGKMYTTAELAGMYTKRQGPDSAAQAKSAREGYDQYIGMGASPEIASAFIAQEKRESGFDPNIVGDNGAARGLYQHHKDRRDNILAGTGIDMWNASAEDQRRGVWWEAHNTESPAFKKMLAAAAKGGEDAAGVAGASGAADFERPADRVGQGAVGAQLSREYYRAFANTPKGTIPSTSPVAPLAPSGGLDIQSLLSTLPAMTGVTGSSSSADNNSTTVHQTNHINVNGGVSSDPNVAAAAIASAVGDKTAQAARNNSVNVK